MSAITNIKRCNYAFESFLSYALECPWFVVVGSWYGCIATSILKRKKWSH